MERIVLRLPRMGQPEKDKLVSLSELIDGQLQVCHASLARLEAMRKLFGLKHTFRSQTGQAMRRLADGLKWLDPDGSLELWLRHAPRRPDRAKIEVERLMARNGKIQVILKEVSE